MTRRINLTPAQQAAYDALRRFFAENGRTPTYRELASAIGVTSLSSVCRLLTGLEERGYIARLPNKNRTITLLDEGGALDLLDLLPPALRDKLNQFCSANREDPRGVVIDAVTLHLDAFDLVPAEGSVVTETVS